MSLFNISGAKPKKLVDAPDSVTESLYKQNLELAVKNKTLSLLRQLYQISILALEPAPLGDKVVETVRNTLEFELVGIFLANETGDKLSPLSFAFSDRLKETAQEFGVNLACEIDGVFENSFLRPIFEAKKPNHAPMFGDIWKGAIADALISSLATSSHVKTTSGYPLIIDGKVIGVLILCLNRAYESLSKFEQESISSLVEVVALALDKARLYLDLEEANKRQERLIHFISHEIKGYMTKNEAAFAGILDGNYGAVADEAKTLAQSALADTRKGVTTVMDILNASNLKKGTVAYDMKPFNLKQMVFDVVKNQNQAAVDKGLTIHTDISDDNLTVTGDAAMIREHVIRNLIDNAIKYTPKGSIVVSLKILGNKALLSVKDTGIGITDETKKVLFTEGGMGKDSKKTNVSSTGIGLFIVKQIVEAHKGRAWAESEGQGKGSTFFVELPVG